MTWLIFRVGAVFISMNNYFTPMVGIVIGVALLDEVLSLTTLLAFVLILIGVAVTSMPRRPPPADPEPCDGPAPPHL